jgi:hypothetical protein
LATLGGASAQSPDAARYPDMRAQWSRLGRAQWDPARPAGRGQQIYLDKAGPDVLHDDITIIHHALTRPWTVQNKCHRERQSCWSEYVCGENNRQVIVGKENCFVSADGYLMPTEKNQPPPELNGSNRPPR